MRNFIALIMFLVLPSLIAAQTWEEQRLFNPDATGAKLRILSSTDTSVFAPLIIQFLQNNPTISIEYLVTGTATLDEIFRADPTSYDLVVSSAMDLQLKLTNDGLARRIETISHPSWAHWRQSLFAFTSEPATIVVNASVFSNGDIPKTRQALIKAMRARPEVFRGRVGTYDIRRSGLGYLFATQDARASETFWRLMEVMGHLDVQLYCCSGDMIRDLESGKIAVAYNVLGSYAAAQIDAPGALQIILPSDFSTTMMRTALVSAKAPNPQSAVSFVRHLTVAQSRTTQERQLLPPLAPSKAALNQTRIALDPALMTYLDALKRKKFLSEWENAVIQN